MASLHSGGGRSVFGYGSSRKRVKSDLGGEAEISGSDGDEVMEAVASPSKPSLSYAAMLRNRSGEQGVDDEVVFSEADCCYSQGKHGLNLTFSERVDAALDRPWRFAVIIKLMGKPNSVNSYDFMLRGLRRKWKSHGGWKLVDLPNGYFIVNFELEHDMEQALCGGPWILAGQTLVVRRWVASFNPLTDKVGSMAVWARIVGLPVKFFNEFAMSKIGKLLGVVVKVDEVTLKQERGKFGRVCVEVELGDPFRPVVEVNGIEYGVQYEGVSLLCFKCGVYGHVKDKCTAGVDVVDSGVSEHGFMSGSVEARPVVPVGFGKGDKHPQESVMSEIGESGVEVGYGPWMLMDYKNRRRSGKSSTAKGDEVQGSRFAVLQEENEAVLQVDTPIPSAELNGDNGVNSPLKPKPVAEIIQMWSCLQSKLKEKAVLGPGFMLDSASDACDISSSAVQNSSSLPKLNAAARVPLVDLSNSVGTSDKKGSRSVRRTVEPAARVKNLNGNAKKLFPGSADLSKIKFAGFYGRSPPEDGMMVSSSSSLAAVPQDVLGQLVEVDATYDVDVDVDAGVSPSSCEGLAMGC